MQRGTRVRHEVGMSMSDSLVHSGLAPEKSHKAAADHVPTNHSVKTGVWVYSPSTVADRSLVDPCMS